MTSQKELGAAGLPAHPGAVFRTRPRHHGLCSRFTLIAGESPEEFASTVNFFFETFHPTTLDGCLAAVNGAMASWMLRRAHSLESELKKADPELPETAEAILRLELPRSTHRRALCRALNALGHDFGAVQPAPAGAARDAIRATLEEAAKCRAAARSLRVP